MNKMIIKKQRNRDQKNTKNRVTPKEDAGDAEDSGAAEEFGGSESGVSNGCDSMIENGTSDGSDSGNDVSAQSSDVEYFEGGNTDSEDAEQNDEPFEATKKETLLNKSSSKRRNIDNNNEKNLKKAKVEKVKAPTLGEINELKETRNLFHSNLFRLQVKEMLEEIKIKEKYKKFVGNWLEKLKIFLKTLPSAEEKESVNAMEWLKACPLKPPLNLVELSVQREKQKPIHFQYIQPNQEPFLIGAAAINCLLGPQIYADICIPMPSSCFLKDNYLNMAYDQKRAFYLTYIAWHLLKLQVFGNLTMENLKFNYFGNNPLKSILEITPPPSNGTGISKKLIFRIFISPEEQTFKLNRFVPWNSNLRPTLFDDLNDDEVITTSTQNYNANILFDLTMKRNEQALLEVFENKKNFQEGLVLLKVWLKQRQLNIGFSGFNSYILAMYIAYLYKQHKLHNNMSSYQVARSVWNNLAHSSWDVEPNGITLYPSGYDQPNQPSLEQFHTYYPVVFIDTTGYYNICSNLSLEIYQRVRLESKLAVDLLNDMKLNSFQLIFMTKYPIYMQIDHFLKINSNEAIEQILEMHVQPADKYNYYGYGFPQALKVVTNLLRKGLKDRIQSILPIETNIEAWNANEPPVKPSSSLHLGIILNPEKAFEVLDKGPESIAENAEEFRRFWGPKAQLRRFQDGTITESVVWGSAADSFMQKRLVVGSIVTYLLKHHFQIEPKHISYIAGDFDIAYKLTPIFKDQILLDRLKIPKQVDAIEASLLVIRCFDDLVRKLQSLNDLPLEIISISGYSSVLRYCDPVPLLPQARVLKDNFVAPDVVQAVIQLGLSGKWPDELGALRAFKVAFYIQIAELLRDKFKFPTRVTNDGLLVIKQGYCFAIEIAHPKEVALLKKEKNEKGITQYVDCPASVDLEKRLYIMPKVTSALHALHQQYPSFGPTVMIAKRWLYSQLIDNGLWPDECTEFLIASMFLKTKPEQITSTPQVGFLRFLQLLASSNWKSEMFVLNFKNSIEETVLSELEQRFSEQRETFPLLTIVTSFDQNHFGLLWTTNDKPNAHILARVSILAQQCLNIVEQSLYSTVNEKFIHPSVIFKPSNEGYNLIIQIKPEDVTTTLAFDYGSSFTAFSKPNWHLPLAGTNFLKDAVENLREAYSDYAAFFYNPCGGKEIAIIWKPSEVFHKKPFKVADVNGTAICATDPSNIQCYKETLIEDFKFILKDYFLRIDSVENILNKSFNSAQLIKQDRYFNKTIIDVTTTSQNKPPTLNPIQRNGPNKSNASKRLIKKPLAKQTVVNGKISKKTKQQTQAKKMANNVKNRVKNKNKT